MSFLKKVVHFINIFCELFLDSETFDTVFENAQLFTMWDVEPRDLEYLLPLK